VPSFLAVVWIFSRHPLYAPYAHARLFAMSPLTDQQLAGFVAKLVTIAVLWTVALVLLLRADRAEAEGDDAEPLTWADVERQFERVERAERRAGRVRQSGPGG
jgi:cytochrome c oxidase assembly factor CtaG